MAFFDEPRPRPGARTFARLGYLFRREPDAWIALVLILAVTSAVAIAASTASIEAMHRVVDAAARTEISLFLRADAARADADALLAEVRAKPEVRTARLETKEDALAALGATALVTPAVGANPLPDSVVVALRPDESRAAAPSAKLDAAAKTFGALPGVVSVDYDRRWSTQLDRWASISGRFDGVVQPIAAVVAALTAFLAALLWGRACRTGPAAPSGLREGSDWVAAGIVGALAAVLSVASAWTTVQAVVTALQRVPVAMQPLAFPGGPTSPSWTWGIAAAIVVASTAGAALGALGRIDRLNRD